MSAAEVRTAMRAHAKVNLRHRVFARDETGHHAVETVLARTSLHDTVALEETEAGITLALEGDETRDVPDGDDNLCVRAARAFLGAAFPRRDPPGVHLRLTKRIPVGAGLGGGSADAAATLRLLAERWPRMDERGLWTLAGALGSDVAFGLLDVPLALGWERGRRLLPFRPPRARPALLVCPPYAVSTPDAYGWLAERRREAGGDPGDAAALPGPARWTDWTVLERLARNDLQPPVLARHPELAGCLEALARAAGGAVLTGSGSALVAWFADGRGRGEGRGAVAAAGADESAGWRLIDVTLPV